MNKNKTEKRAEEILQAAGKYAARWLYLAALVAVSVYAFFVWDKYIFKADWSEEKKQSYIREQAVFSFDKEGYNKAVNLLKTKKEKFDSGEKYNGRDLFFPEGF